MLMLNLHGLVVAGLLINIPSFSLLLQSDGLKPPTALPSVIRRSGSDLEREAVKKSEPEYPAIAKAARASGTVKVEIEIDGAGKVISARAVSGHPLLRDSAEQAARQWRFKPTLLFGKTAKVIGILTFNFVLDGGKSDGSSQPEKAADPDSAEARYERGLALSKSKHFDEAITELTEAVRLKPDHRDAHYELGYVYMSAGRYGEAESACRKSLQLQPEYDEFYSPRAMMCVGLAAIYQGKHDEAISQFRQVAERERAMYDVRLFLAVALHRKGDSEGAMAALKESLALKPDNPNSHFLAAQIYASQSRLKEAVEAYKQGMKFDPDRPEAHLGLGQAYLKMGDRPSALKEYRALKKLGSELAEQLLDEINR
jgi:TonB family protein